MSMEVKGIYNHSQINHAEEVKEKQTTERAEKAKETNKNANAAKLSNEAFEPHDEYISSEKSGTKPTGLYRVGQDENGNRKIFFDDLNKSGHTNEKEQSKINGDNSEEDRESGQPKVNGDNQGKPAEKCTGNTDEVDKEIRKLKEKKQQLEQQIRLASEDEKKVQELEKKLTQVENELKRKDNDTYRRQNTLFTTEN